MMIHTYSIVVLLETKYNNGEEKQTICNTLNVVHMVCLLTKHLVKELQKYFRISSLEILKRRDFLIQYKTEDETDRSVHIMNSNAWVQTAINMGMQKEVQNFNKKRLEEVLPRIQTMTSRKPQEVCAELDKILADSGVALVLLPNLKKCKVKGAVKWLGKEKVILALNNCEQNEDSFWFSLFHELGHIMQQRIKILMISDENYTIENDELMQRLETEADAFAKKMLHLE